MASTANGDSQGRPEVGDILLVIHDFSARSSDELSLAKGDRVELIERDDEFGDGWFLGKHLVNGNSGLFPEVYTRPAPKNIANTTTTAATQPTPVPSATSAASASPETTLSTTTRDARSLSSPNAPSSAQTESNPVTLPLSSIKTESTPNLNAAAAASSTNQYTNSLGTGLGLSRFNSQNKDSPVLHETLTVIDEHITDLHSTPTNGTAPHTATDSGSEYSSHLDHRLSYIQGEETDEEEEDAHTRPEVESWSADNVAEYLFTIGVEKKHCEVFRDQEITGEVLLGMDQSSLFLKAFDLGPVGRRLKTWQKIKALQDEVNGIAAKRTTLTTSTYGSDAGSEGSKRMRSRNNTLTSSFQKPPVLDERPSTAHARRLSQTPRLDPTSPITPVSPKPLQESPSRPSHHKRPSAASVRELHHSRRHSSNDYRIGAPTVSSGTPKLASTGTFPQGGQATVAHKKQPSFDRNWTMGGASTGSSRPLSSTGLHDILGNSNPDLQEQSAADLDRGYFSGGEVEGKKRNVLKKRDSATTHSRQSSYADEQRVRSATALSRHSRFGSVNSIQENPVPSSAAQQYYGLSSGPHRRTASTNTTNTTSSARNLQSNGSAPTVTKLDSNSIDTVRSSPISPVNRQAVHGDWMTAKGAKMSGFGGLRAISDAVTGTERSKLMSPVDSPIKESPMPSPARTGSSTPSGGPSFELDSQDAAKSPSTVTTAGSRKSGKKTKKETSAYLRGLAKVGPKEAMQDADYSGWMKKKSSHLMTTWKPRLFVLKGRRLAYFYSEDDTEEKGLIDISFHRVLPADNERLTGLHATLTGASSTPVPAESNLTTSAEADAAAQVDKGADTMFIFKLVPPRAGLSKAVNFTKPTVHYFAVPNLKQGRMWMAALMRATIDRDDTVPMTSTYQQKTISLAKARAMRHRPPALMNLDEKIEDSGDGKDGSRKEADGGLGISFNEVDSAVSGIEKLALQGIDKPSASANPRKTVFDSNLGMFASPQSA